MIRAMYVLNLYSSRRWRRLLFYYLLFFLFIIIIYLFFFFNWKKNDLILFVRAKMTWRIRLSRR